MTAGLIPAGWLLAQNAPRPVVVLKVAVTDRQGRYVNGLKPSDFRVFEDGILQTISTFAKPPLLTNDGNTRPESDQETFESIRGDLDKSYTITYQPDPSNHNDGFRKINVEIVPDVEKRWRVRHRPGYRSRPGF